MAITMDLTAIGDGNMSKFLHGRLLDIGRYPHFQKVGIASFFPKATP